MSMYLETGAPMFGGHMVAKCSAPLRRVGAHRTRVLNPAVFSSLVPVLRLRIGGIRIFAGYRFLT